MGCGASTSAPAKKPEAQPETATATSTPPSAPPAAPPTAAPASSTAAPAAFDRRGLLERTFKALDSDGDGSIDLKEFLQQAKHSDDNMELQMMMSFMDANNDGVLSLDEWMQGIEQLGASDEALEKEMKDVLQVVEGAKTAPPEIQAAEEPAAAGDDMDRDDMDDLDAMIDDMATSGQTALVEKAKVVFDRLDVDSGGTLSKEELAAGISADSEFTALLVESTGAADADEAVKKLDLLGGGEITWMEFEIIVTGIAGEAPP